MNGGGSPPAAAALHDEAVRGDLPAGTVTFLFTDVEGSTRLLQQLGAEGFAAALAEHRRLLREAFAAEGGVEVDTQGDAFFIAFSEAAAALKAAAAAQEALASGPIRVRMGLHTGAPHLAEEGYVGEDVHLGARIAAVGHGGQVVVSAATRSFLGGELTELGEHRLKDFDRPVALFQLGRERFPPLKTISNTNLPRPASTFVGREREVAEVVGLLRGDARLVTLSGPGGSGKTRLAIEAAAELVSEFKAGVFWVGLATLRDPALVLETVGQTLGADGDVASHIGERELLLLLDNLEQVVEAASDVGSLLEACPNLRLLVTSRELLRVGGELDYPVLPLIEEDAVSLFCARAQTKPDDSVAELCRRLDNLPLALELAAARANALPPAQILDRLGQRLDLLKGGRDADPRQYTLRSTIAWSHDLLQKDEQRLFARLAVFAGGCRLESAEEVCEADLDVVQSLVDKSLLRRTGDRFWMLETIREFAAGQLRHSGEAGELERRHAEYYLALAEEAAPHLPAGRREWLERLESEHDNLRAALDCFEAAGEVQVVLQLAGTLARFWMMRGHFVEARRRLDDALCADDRPTAARARALNGASQVAADHETARLRAEEGLSLHRALEDEWGIAHSELLLAGAVAATDMRRATELWEEAARRFDELGDEHHVMIVVRSLAYGYISLGERERGRALHEENLRRARELGNERIEAITLGALGAHAVEDGRFEEAVALLEESHRLHTSLGEPFQSACDACRFAFLLLAQGRAETAATVFSSAEVLCEEIGTDLHGWDPHFIDGIRAEIQARLDDDALARASEQGRKLTADEAITLALDSLSRELG
jgi:predicted ATPase/class 3 adenylate cyclase